MGKGAVDETLPNYGGVYAGDGSHKSVKDFVESSDLILSIGAIKSDFNTAGFSYRISQLSTIDFHSNHINVRYSEYSNTRMQSVLRKVIDRIDPSKLSISPVSTFSNVPQIKSADEGQTITQAWFWPRVGQWLKQRDIVITETGTANFGIWETRFPADVTAISQVLWGSIGYSVGACQGAVLAAHDAGLDSRTILFVGDGSFQLTCQEISTMIRHGLKPIIFLICNDGYTIERFIHGMDASYNDIQTWKNKDLLAAFGATPETSATYTIKTKDQCNELLTNKEFAKADKIQFVELYIPKKDAPRALILTAESSAKTNAKED